MYLSTFIRKITPFLMGIALFFIAMTILQALFPTTWGLGEFSLRFEWNLAVWFQSLLFLFVSVTFFALFAKKELGPKTRAISAVFSGIFLFLSADEVGGIHESMASLIAQNEELGIGNIFRDTFFSWILYYTPAMLIGFFFLHRTYGPHTNGTFYLVATFIFAFSVILLEGIGAILYSLRPEEQSVGAFFHASSILAYVEVLEETSEILALFSLAKYNQTILDHQKNLPPSL